MANFKPLRSIKIVLEKSNFEFYPMEKGGHPASRPLAKDYMENNPEQLHGLTQDEAEAVLNALTDHVHKYCNTFGIIHESLDEMMLDEGLEPRHRKQFAIWSEMWDHIAGTY